ncbi:MAG: serine/threonine protein kinase, partial [Myxococcales bacterium]|nr:serine/threonine protein kinase [Myxococcales bacterium]
MAHDDPLIGTVLDGRYEIVRPLGRGGMGAVYEAINTRLGKRVALKTLRADLAPSDDNYRRFQQEAEVAASLGHPHICESHDFRAAKDGEPAFIVMDYLEGEDLEQRIARAGPLPLARVVVLVDEIAGALHAAHERGVVHRDLKPQNIFLCRYGERDDYPKVLDFGVSKVRHEPSVETAQSEAYLGSPHYMAPEQAEGYSARADARTDIFALGGIIFRMLSGEHAYSAPNLPAILHQIVYGEPRVLSEVAPDVPLAVSEVVARALSKKPAARFGSVKSLASALALAAEQSARRRATSEQGVRQAQSEVETAPTVKAETPRSLSIAPEAREATRPRGGRGGLLLAAAVVGLVALGGFVALRWGSGGPPASARA